MQKRSQIGVVNPHPQDRAHSGLHDLRVEAVGRSLRADDVGDAEPVGQPDDRAEVAGVLHVVERQRQPPRERPHVQPVAGRLDDRQRVGGGFEQRQPLHVARGDGLDLRPCEHALQREDLADLQVRAAQFADEFLPFGHEQSVFRASAFVGQRADELYFGFRHRCFSMVKVTPSVAG